MMKLSLFDKLGLFFNVASNSYWSILILIVLLGIGILFSSKNKKKIKRNKIIYIIFTIVIIVSLLIGYSLPISKVFDNMMNNLFIVIYFPNLAVYFGALIATSIILWISIFNYKTTEAIKRLNLIIYIIMNYLFGLLLYVIKTNKLDIFSGESIYTNSEATALIELSSIIFILWILFLIIYKIILIALKKEYKPEVKKVIVKKEVKKLPDNYQNIKIPNIVYINKPSMIKIKEDNKLYTEIEAPKLVYSDIFMKPKKDYYNVEIPNKVYGNKSKKKISNYYTIDIPDMVYANNKKKPAEDTKLYEDMLSVDDYKLLLKLLLKEKQKEKEVKPVREEKHKEVAQPNLTELENLYRSIR